MSTNPALLQPPAHSSPTLRSCGDYPEVGLILIRNLYWNTNKQVQFVFPDTHSKRVKGGWDTGVRSVRGLVFLNAFHPWGSSYKGRSRENVLLFSHRESVSLIRELYTWLACQEENLSRAIWLFPPRLSPFHRVNNTQPRPSRPRAVLWWVRIGSKRARLKSDEMLSCVLPFCVCPSLHHEFAYDFPGPAVTHATSCSITPCFPLLLCLIWL